MPLASYVAAYLPRSWAPAFDIFQAMNPRRRPRWPMLPPKDERVTLLRRQQAAGEIQLRGTDAASGQRVTAGPGDWFDGDFVLSHVRLSRGGWLHSVEVRLCNNLSDQRVRMLREVWTEHGRPRWNAI